MVTVDGAPGLSALEGQELGETEWETMAFSRIQTFADATDDHQWIHVDRARIAEESPFGAPISHGYLTLALIAGRFFQLLTLQGFAMVINYGTERVRFPSPLREGDRFRLSLRLGEIHTKGDWIQAIFHATVQIEGATKPACVAQCVYRFLPK